MKEKLPATHLLRQFLLFTSIVLFLLLMVRAGYALWRFDDVEQVTRPELLFLTGIRYDLSLIGVLCFVPLVVGSLLAMFSAGRVLAKVFVTLWLFLSLAFILICELLTPLFFVADGARPVASSIVDIQRLIQLASSTSARYPLPTTIATLLVALILIAYLARMEWRRFLRFSLSPMSAIALGLIGGVVCVVAALSELTFVGAHLTPGDAAVGGPPIVDQIVMNSGWTILYSLVEPYL